MRHPQNLSHFPQSLPPAYSQQISSASELQSRPHPPHLKIQNLLPLPRSTLSEMRIELHQTHACLTSHVDKVLAPRGSLAEQGAIEPEVITLRDLIHALSSWSSITEPEEDDAFGIQQEHIEDGDESHGEGVMRVCMCKEDVNSRVNGTRIVPG
jgi:hypothetical protein